MGPCIRCRRVEVVAAWTPNFTSRNYTYFGSFKVPTNYITTTTTTIQRERIMSGMPISQFASSSSLASISRSSRVPNRSSHAFNDQFKTHPQPSPISHVFLAEFDIDQLVNQIIIDFCFYSRIASC